MSAYVGKVVVHEKASTQRLRAGDKITSGPQVGGLAT